MATRTNPRALEHLGHMMRRSREAEEARDLELVARRLKRLEQSVVEMRLLVEGVIDERRRAADASRRAR